MKKPKRWKHNSDITTDIGAITRNKACDEWETYLKKIADVEKLKKIVLQSDLDFHKQPCCDDEFNEWCYFIAKAISKHIRGE